MGETEKSPAILRIEALCRLLESEGHITRAGSLQIVRTIEEELRRDTGRDD